MTTAPTTSRRRTLLIAAAPDGEPIHGCLGRDGDLR